MTMSKVVNSTDVAVRDIPDGASIAVGGFGMPGAPIHLMRALLDTTVTGVEIIANNGGLFEWQLAPMLAEHRVRRVIASHIGLNRNLEKAFRSGEVEVELIPQGTFAERLRAGGSGIPAFYVATGAGTLVETGGLPWRYNSEGQVIESSPRKPTQEMDGHTYVMETAIRPDVALIHAAVSDTHGNLRFHQSARNFNPLMARAAKHTIVEAERIVEPGELRPDDVHLPGVWVDTVVEVGTQGKRLELVSPPVAEATEDYRHRIAKRAALEVTAGSYTNLGVGIPALAGRYVPQALGAVLHCENGVLGLGGAPKDEDVSVDLVDASKLPASIVRGGAFVDSAEAFSIIRAGRLDLSLLGALQVSAAGDIANWIVPGKAVAGMGGAMDLVSGARRVVALMTHTDATGTPKLLARCTFPLTGAGVVSRVITELAVVDIVDGAFVLRELAPGVTVEQVLAATDGPVLVPDRPELMKGVSS